jgi:hypothetical protein
LYNKQEDKYKQNTKTEIWKAVGVDCLQKELMKEKIGKNKKIGVSLKIETVMFLQYTGIQQNNT